MTKEERARLYNTKTKEQLIDIIEAMQREYDRVVVLFRRTLREVEAKP